MTWEIVVGIFALVTGIAAIAKPVIDLTNSITMLTYKADELAERFEGQIQKNSEAHERVWKHNDKQDKILMNHETRLNKLEKKE